MDLKERQDFRGVRHPWEVVRAQFFLSLLDRFSALASRGDWLDIGAGDAWIGGQLSSRLPACSRVVCWDSHYGHGELATAQLGGPVEKVAARPAAQFDGVLLLDVIEHVADDRQFVTDAVGNLARPGGWILASVPAYPALFSNHDRFLGHYRRYRPAHFAAMLEASGVEVAARGGLFHCLVPVRAAQVAGERLFRRSAAHGGVGAWNGGATLTRVVTTMLAADARASITLGSRGWTLPGLSCWVLGKRRQ